jgi:hypothetical protein
LPVLPVGAASDELTPSGSQHLPVSASEVGESSLAALDLDEISGEITEVIPFQLSRFDQVVQNAHNWHGVADSSLRCELAFTPVAVFVQGEFIDDRPFCQAMIHPSKPGWWRTTYGADGIEFLLDDPTSATRRVQFALNLSSRAVNPKVDIVSSLSGSIPGFARGGVLELSDGQAPDSLKGEELGTAEVVRFRAAVPITSLAEPKFFTGPLKASVRLHDVDGDLSTYLMMEQTAEKRPVQQGN